MILMVLVVICYTITSLNDKYAVSKAEMNGSQMTFVMADRHIVLYDIHPALSEQNF